MGREYPTKDGVCCLCDDGVVATGYCIEDCEHIAYPISCICLYEGAVPIPIKEILQEMD